MGLIGLQCMRRFFETNFIQIFSKASRINFSHYVVGYLHYFGVVTFILGAAEGFVAHELVTPPTFGALTLSDLTFTWLFIYAWFYQLQSNLILVGMRKNKSGQVVTEKHLVPRGGYFELISSPHMFFEVVMYIALSGLLRHNITALYCALWVTINQIHNAYLTHKWYKETFRDYPVQRKAIVPYLL